MRRSQSPSCPPRRPANRHAQVERGPRSRQPDGSHERSRDRSRSPRDLPRHELGTRHRFRGRASPAETARVAEGSHRRRRESLSRSPLSGDERSKTRDVAKRTKASTPLPSQQHSYMSSNGSAKLSDSLSTKERPNYNITGALAAEANKVDIGTKDKPRAIVLKYHEPSDARKPSASEIWMLYVFKGNAKDPLETIPLHTRSCWLLGRETAVADIPLDHPSLSKQHCVLQWRGKPRKDGVGLYVLDLESSNGTTLNGTRIEAARFIECKSNDVLRLGESQRDYVILQAPQSSMANL